MKFLLSSFLIILLMISFTQVQAKVIFDPAAYTPADASQAIDTIDGVVYLRVILNGWNSTINIPEVTLGNCDKVNCNFKYTLGAASAATLTLAKINGVVQIMDTINTVPNPWGAGMVPSSTGLSQSPVTGNLGAASASIAAAMKVVNKIQFFGQETVGWGPTTGDTIWVGKVSAFSSRIPLDPTSMDPSELPDGMSIVTKDGKICLQVILNGWNSNIFVTPTTLKENQKAVCEFKYALGTTSAASLTLAKINAVVQVMDTVNTIPNPWGGSGNVPSSTGIVQSPATGNWTTCSSALSSSMKLINEVQFFGQETVSWGPTTGDTIWVGKIKIVSNDANVVLDPAEADVEELPAGMSVVTISSKKYYQVILNGWNSNIFLNPVALNPGYKAQCDFKYAMGAASAATLTLDKINGVVQLMDTVNTIPNPWGAGVVPSSTGLSQSPVTGTMSTISASMNATMKLINEVQFFGQETVGWGPTTGDTVWVGKISIFDPNATITFIVDDSNLKTSTGFGLKGSWKTTIGVYDANWNDGAEHTKFFDDGTHGDATAGDNIWSVALELVVDNGTNTWEWGINDSKGTWCLVGANQQFKLNDASNQTLTYANTVSVNKFGNAKIKVYPNPAHDMINISNSDLKSVEIYNIAGAKVFGTTVNCQNINVATLKAGSYIIKAYSTDGNAFVSKFVKN